MTNPLCVKLKALNLVIKFFVTANLIRVSWSSPLLTCGFTLTWARRQQDNSSQPLMLLLWTDDGLGWMIWSCVADKVRVEFVKSFSQNMHKTFLLFVTIGIPILCCCSWWDTTFCDRFLSRVMGSSRLLWEYACIIPFFRVSKDFEVKNIIKIKFLLTNRFYF